MSQTISLAEFILQKLHVVVFRRKGPWQYEIYGVPPAFFLDFFAICQAEGEVNFWHNSDMMEFFLTDIEEFFSSPQDEEATINSGIWHENSPSGQEMSFIAHALYVNNEELVIVRVLGEEYEEKMRILQKARENLLERRRLSVDLNEYKQRSRRDGLTGLYNRSTFDELLKENMTLAERTGASLSLILIDIDNFKHVNDTYGHVAGDKVLAELGQLLQNILRREDIPCRYGGEEFAIIAPYTTHTQAALAAEKVRCRVEDYLFKDLPRITVSIGCSTYQPDESAENFFHRADLALYDAKHAGKNRVFVR